LGLGGGGCSLEVASPLWCNSAMGTHRLGGGGRGAKSGTRAVGEVRCTRAEVITVAARSEGGRRRLSTMRSTQWRKVDNTNLLWEALRDSRPLDAELHSGRREVRSLAVLWCWRRDEAEQRERDGELRGGEMNFASTCEAAMDKGAVAVHVGRCPVGTVGGMTRPTRSGGDRVERSR
jgi:hypothetical protein